MVAMIASPLTFEEISPHYNRTTRCSNVIVSNRLLVKQSLQWRRNGNNGVSNHQSHGCLLSPLLRSRSNKTSKLRVTGRCAGNSPLTGEFPAQMDSNAENVSFWWRHHRAISHISISSVSGEWIYLWQDTRLPTVCKYYDDVVLLNWWIHSMDYTTFSQGPFTNMV